MKYGSNGSLWRWNKLNKGGKASNQNDEIRKKLRLLNDFSENLKVDKIFGFAFCDNKMVEWEISKQAVVIKNADRWVGRLGFHLKI